MRGVNFGCGLSCGVGWRNYDASLTLYFQRFPVFGTFARQFIKPRFPVQARFGNILHGLPEPTSGVDLVYCSHVLEHLSLEEFNAALNEILRILKPGGVFRGVLPDLELEVAKYHSDASDNASSAFMRSTCLGVETRPAGLIGRVRESLGRSQHLWMWDYKGLEGELKSKGFTDIRRAYFGDSAHEAFKAVEEADRWKECLGFECRCPD